MHLHAPKLSQPLLHQLLHLSLIGFVHAVAKGVLGPSDGVFAEVVVSELATLAQ